MRLRRLLALVLFWPAAAAAGPTAERVFAEDPGTDTPHACFHRLYDRAHLAAHPHQNVASMVAFLSGTRDAEGTAAGAVAIGVTFRRTGSAVWSVGGGCSGERDGRLTCAADCDGGAIDVRLMDADTVIVEIPAGARVSDDDGEEPADRHARFGSDDTVFRLTRAPLADCLPVIWDDDVKDRVKAGR